jgi:hypothetical protein
MLEKILNTSVGSLFYAVIDLRVPRHDDFFERNEKAEIVVTGKERDQMFREDCNLVSKKIRKLEKVSVKINTKHTKSFD